VFNRLYVVAPGPAPTPSLSPTPAPTGQSSPATDVTLPPTDRTPAGNQSSGSPSTQALIAVIGIVVLFLLAASSRRKRAPARSPLTPGQIDRSGLHHDR
jgi:hypothetical protein